MHEILRGMGTKQRSNQGMVEVGYGRKIWGLRSVPLTKFWGANHGFSLLESREILISSAFKAF